MRLGIDAQIDARRRMGFKLVSEGRWDVFEGQAAKGIESFSLAR